MKDYLTLLADDFVLSSRIQRIRDAFFETTPSICVQRARLYTESIKKNQQYPMTLKRAMALKHVLENIDLYISEGELIVGSTAEAPRGSSVFPEFSTKWIIDEFNGNPYNFSERPGDKFVYTEQVKKELLEDILPYWKGKTQEDRVIALMPETTWEAGMKVGGFSGSWIMGSGDGHIIPDFARVVNSGVRSVIQQAKDKLASLDLSNPEDLRKEPFLRATIIANEAILAYAARFSEYAKKLADSEKDEKRKDELLQISDIAKRVPEHPAQSFQEALQSIMFVNVAIQLENNGLAISFGRFDQFLYPYYRQDIEKSVLTPQSAFELLNCFWMKVNEMSKFRDWESTKFFVGYLVYQNLTIAGQTLSGKDAVNELSYICLASTKQLRMIQPSLSVRYFNGTSDRFLMECVKTISLGIGMPALYSDEVIIPSLLAIGYSIEDAINYGIVGCVEPSAQGKSGGRYGACFTNPTKSIELAINGGRDPRSGIRLVSSKDLSQVSSYEEFMEEYEKQVLFFLKHHVIWDNIIDLAWEELIPNPLLSSHVHDCIERGRDIKQGGAVYDYTGGVICGVASAVNCMASLKRVLFDKKLLTAEQLMHALETDFQDNTTNPTGEEIQKLLVYEGSKFGNNEDEVDDITSDFLRFWSTNKTGFKNTRYGRGPIGGFFIPSTATVASNVGTGQIVGATPDGRRAFDHLSEGISAFRGTDTNGPTALINSIGAIPNLYMHGGQLLNVKLNPSSMKDESGKRNVIALIKSLFAQKGMHIQFNVVDKEQLLEAKREPEKHQDLIVRVAGYSAFFTTLAEDVQNDIIERTEHKI